MPTSRTEIEWRRAETGELAPFVDGLSVVWAPQPGSQDAFLQCPVFEALLEGPRGSGKTDALIMDFVQHVGQGFGAEWRGVLFRQTYKQLEDVISKTKKWIRRISPSATFNETKMYWGWPGGERLNLSYMDREADYWNYHGFSFPWIGWEELTTWPDDRCYKVMMSCCRSTNPRLPRKYRATTNPYGVGHNWCRHRFHLPIPPGQTAGKIIVDPERRLDRVAIHSRLEENLVLTTADPSYAQRVATAARNKSELAAWIEGSWDIVAGGMIDDVWVPAVHVLPDIQADMIPRRWRIDRSYDHGQSAPFSVGWWAESNGEPTVVGGRRIGTVRGDLVRVAEWYGWSGKPNEGIRMSASEVARGIMEREARMGLQGRVQPGPADSSIFDDYDPGRSVAGDMRREGIEWLPADKGPGSRRQGWEQLRQRLRDGAARTRERPGLFVCQGCEQFLRTVPVLPRADRDLDDVDTDAEDHVGDEVRYRLRSGFGEMKVGSWR